MKEEKLRNSGDPKFSHLKDDLHVEITAFAPPAEAHARIAYALTEVRRFLVPVSTLYEFLCFLTLSNANIIKRNNKCEPLKSIRKIHSLTSSDYFNYYFNFIIHGGK